MGNGLLAAAGGRDARTRRAPVARRRSLPTHLCLVWLCTSLPPTVSVALPQLVDAIDARSAQRRWSGGRTRGERIGAEVAQPREEKEVA